jgi:GNAT superfamily N-acetyltransferase
MNCQITKDSIHSRPGWSLEYLLTSAGQPAAYGSLAIAGPWKDRPTVYEFFVLPDHRTRAFDLFTALLEATQPVAIETQSNAPMLTVMLHAFAHDVTSEAILFHDRITTALPPPPGVTLRHPTPADNLPDLHPDQYPTTAVLELDGRIAATGGILFHYNPPYGDIYMEVAEPHRRRGLGAYLVQELKRIARERGNTPAARCNVNNLASRRTLQKAGFVPCGHILTGSLV